MNIKHKQLLASALLLLLASIQLSLAAWYYEKENIVEVQGVVHPGGFTSTVISVELNAGQYVSKNATVHAIIPQESNVEFYVSSVENETALEEYNVTVIIGNEVVGTITSSQNVTTTLPQGEHDIVFQVNLKAAVDVSEETTFKITIGVRAEAA